MKIAFTAHGQDCYSTVDSRFGRADFFVIYDEEKGEWTSLPNTQNLEAAHGAGIQAGQNVARTGAKVLITGNVGPKAFKVLEAEQIAMYSFNDENVTVEETLAAFQSGLLKTITSAGPAGIRK